MDSPFKNQNSVSSAFTMKCQVCGLTCLVFVMSNVCLSSVCYVLGLLCQGFVVSRVCYVQGLSCLGFVMSRVYRVQGLLCLGFVVSSVCLSMVCYVQCLSAQGWLCHQLICCVLQPHLLFMGGIRATIQSIYIPKRTTLFVSWPSIQKPIFWI